MREKLERLAKSLKSHAEELIHLYENDDLHEQGFGWAVAYQNIAEDIEQILKEDEH